MILISKYKPNDSTCQWREKYWKTDSSLSLHVSAYEKGSILYKLWQGRSLVVCSVVFANYTYLRVIYATIGLYSLNSTLLKADKE